MSNISQFFKGDTRKKNRKIFAESKVLSGLLPHKPQKLMFTFGVVEEIVLPIHQQNTVVEVVVTPVILLLLVLELQLELVSVPQQAHQLLLLLIQLVFQH